MPRYDRRVGLRLSTEPAVFQCRHTVHEAWSSGRASFSRYSEEQPFLSRLAAVRCAFRWVASIMTVSGSPHLAAKLLRMRSNTPIRDQRTKRLYSVLCGPQISGASRASKAVSDNADNPTYHATVIDTRSAMGSWEVRFDGIKLDFAKPVVVRHGQVLLPT